MSRHFENFVMDVFPWKTITVCLVVVAVAQFIQVFQGWASLRLCQ